MLSVHLFIMCLCAVVKASIYLWVCVLSWHLFTFACLFNCVCVRARVCPWQLSVYMYLPLCVAEPLRSCWACISQKLSTCGLWAVSLLNSSWAGLSIQAPQNMIRWVQGPGREVTLCTLPDHHSVVDKRRESVCGLWLGEWKGMGDREGAIKCASEPGCSARVVQSQWVWLGTSGWASQQQMSEYETGWVGIGVIERDGTTQKKWLGVQFCPAGLCVGISFVHTVTEICRDKRQCCRSAAVFGHKSHKLLLPFVWKMDSEWGSMFGRVVTLV